MLTISKPLSASQVLPYHEHEQNKRSFRSELTKPQKVIFIAMRSSYRMVWFACLVLLGGFPCASMGQTQQDVVGEWALNLGKRTLLVLSLHPISGKSDSYTGSLSRPTHLTTSDAVSFSHIEGPIEIDPIVASGWKNNALSITVENPKNSRDRTVYLLTVKDATHAELQLDGVPIPPMKLTRATQNAAVSEDWHSGQTYSPGDDAPSNPEMKRIFDADQSDRKSWPNIDWSAVSKADAARRAATMKLLNAGALRSGEDFEWAANVFQHGSDPNDFLLAHTLAIVAIRKGYADGTWIAAATLDRYLQSIKQPQIYGTQFLNPDNSPTTQEPYNRILISDTIRRLLGVPDLEAQKIQSQKYDSQRDVGTKSPKP
jgi:hypothetical protein